MYAAKILDWTQKHGVELLFFLERPDWTFLTFASPKNSVTKYFHLQNENDIIMVRRQISTLKIHKEFAILQIGHLFLSIFRFGKILLVKNNFRIQINCIFIKINFSKK